MDLFVLNNKKGNHYNLSLGNVQAPPRVQQEISSTLTSSPTPNMATREDSNLSSQVNNGSPNSSSIYPLECSAFNLFSSGPMPVFIVFYRKLFSSNINGILPLLDGVAPLLMG